MQRTVCHVTNEQSISLLTFYLIYIHKHYDIVSLLQLLIDTFIILYEFYILYFSQNI